MSYTIGMLLAHLALFLAVGIARCEESSPPSAVPSPEAAAGLAWAYDAEFRLPIPKGDSPRIALTVPAGTAMITDSGSSGVLRVWKSEDGYELTMPKPDRPAILAVASRDLLYQAYFDTEGDVYLRRGYEASEKAYSFRSRGEKAPSSSIFFSDDPVRLAVFSGDAGGRLHGVILETGRKKVLSRMDRLDGGRPPVTADAQAEVFAGTFSAGGFWIWDSGSGRKAASPETGGAFSLLVLSPDATRMLACGARPPPRLGASGTAREERDEARSECSLWNPREGRRLSVWTQTPPPGSAAFAPDGTRVFYSSEGALEVRDAGTGAVLWTLDEGVSGGRLSVMPDSSILVRLEESGRVVRWTLSTFGAALAQFRKEIARFEGEEAQAEHRIRFRTGQTVDAYNRRLASLREKGPLSPEVVGAQEQAHAKELDRIRDDSDNRRRGRRDHIARLRARTYFVEYPDAGLLLLTEWSCPDGEKCALVREPRLYDSERGRVFPSKERP